MTSAHPTPTTGTAMNVAVSTRKTSSVAIIMLIHQDLDPSATVALRNIAKLENINLHLQNQFINSTQGKGALTIHSEIILIEDPGPFYTVANSNEMITSAQTHIRDQFYTQYPDSFDFLAYALVAKAPCRHPHLGHQQHVPI